MNDDLPPFPLNQPCEWPECRLRANTRIRGPQDEYRYACPDHAESVAEAWRAEIDLDGWSEADKREAWGR